MNHFHQLFPEVSKSNETGKITKDSFALWKPSSNEISIELDTAASISKYQPKYDVYIGGPASACAAALHASSGN